MMGAAGFEPATTWSEAKHSIQTELSARTNGFTLILLTLAIPSDCRPDHAFDRTVASTLVRSVSDHRPAIKKNIIRTGNVIDSRCIPVGRYVRRTSAMSSLASG